MQTNEHGQKQNHIPTPLSEVMTVLCGEDVPSYPMVTSVLLRFVEAGRRISLQYEPRSRDAHTKLSVKKTVVLLKILYCRIVESVAADSPPCGHKHYDDLV